VNLLSALALGFVVAGIVSALAASAATRDVRAGLPMMMELWTAAGIIRLGNDPSWNAVLTAAIVLALRKLVLVGMHPDRVLLRR
jgi:hypothetical protein